MEPIMTNLHRRRFVSSLALGAIGAGCAPIQFDPYPQPKIALPEETWSNGFLIQTEGLLFRGYEVAGVRGIATNATNTTYKIVIVRFALLNASGVRIADAQAATYDLAGRQKWAFRAEISSGGGVPFQSVAAPTVTAA